MADDEIEQQKKGNADFAEWWLSMHRASVALGSQPAEYLDARAYFDGDWTPGDAARDWQSKRKK